MAHREVQLLKTLKHQHVIRYYNSFHDEKSLYIVMEYCERGDLYKVDSTFKIFIHSIIVDKGIKIQEEIFFGKVDMKNGLVVVFGCLASAFEKYYT